MLAGAILAAAVARATPPPEPGDGKAVLELADDGFLRGRLVAVAAGPAGHRETILWESPLFDGPLEFAVAGIARIRFPTDRPAPPAGDAWHAEFTGSEVVQGTLESLDADHVVMRSAGAGDKPLRIRRAAVTRLFRPAATAARIVPGGLEGWEAGGSGWREAGGRLVCEQAGGVCFRDVAAPARACFELVLSWDERPDLEMLFAAGPEEAAGFKAGRGPAEKPKPKGEGRKSPAECYRVEVTEGNVLAVREGGKASFDQAATLPAGPGGLRLRVFVDQEKGRLVVVLPDTATGDKPVFDQAIPPGKPGPGKGFGIKLRRGAVRLDGLRVNAWADAEPRLSTAGLFGGGGSVVESFDKQTGMFKVREGEADRQVPAAEVAGIEFAAVPPAAAPSGSVLAGLDDGSRIGGRIVAVTPTALVLDCPALAEPLECSMRHLAVIDVVGGPRPAGLPGRPGWLEADDGRMLGCLVDGPVGGTVGWQPRGAVAPQAVAAAPGPLQLSYRGLRALGGVGLALARQDAAWVVSEVAVGGPAARDGRVAVGWRLDEIRLGDAAVMVGPLKADGIRDLLRGVAGSTTRLRFTDSAGQPQEVALVRDKSGRGDLGGGAEKDVLDKALKLQEAVSSQARKAGGGPATVFLKTGDALLCTVLAAGSDGLRIKTDLVPDRLVPAAAMRAVELLPSTTSAIPKDKLARLLTLPRMLQSDPPTHLVRLASGDYLRGKLLSLDDTVLRMDVLGVTKELPRSEVSRLIWLSREGDGSEAEALAAVVRGPEGGLPLRATMTDGRRLTMKAERVVGDRLEGTSGVFGALGIDLNRCERLELHPSSSDVAAASLPYGQWKLRPAPVPRALK
jgi:hypothetical protein